MQKDTSRFLASVAKSQINDLPAYVTDKRVPLDSETVLRNPEYHFTGKIRKNIKIYKKGNYYILSRYTTYW